MARHFIKDGRGNQVKNSRGDRLFWSDRDGDRPNNQTVYCEHKGLFGGSSKVISRYDPSTGKFKK